MINFESLFLKVTQYTVIVDAYFVISIINMACCIKGITVLRKGTTLTLL